MIFLGTIVNAVGIALGALIGVLISGLLAKHKKLEKIPDAIMKAMGLCVIYIGISGTISNQQSASDTLGSYAILITIGAIAIGTLIGELIDIDKGLNILGASLERKMTKRSHSEDGDGAVKDKSIARGFVSATLLFCVGAMAITGAIESGLSGGSEQGTLFAKSAIDMISAVVFGATLGIGTVFSAVSVLIYQGVIELIAIFVGDFLPAVVTAEMSATGSVLIMAIGLNMVGATKIKVANMLPAIFLPLLLCFFF